MDGIFNHIITNHNEVDTNNNYFYGIERLLKRSDKNK